MKKIKPLDYQQLRCKLDVSQLHFKTTDEIAPVKEFFGQKRALEALAFGVGIRHQGYNLYAMGPTGIGKRSLIKMFLKRYTKKSEIPSDWCYIHNFDIPERPIALQFPHGMGHLFQYDMKVLIEELSRNVLTVFESHEYRLKKKKISIYFDKKRKPLRKKIIEGKADVTPELYKQQHEKEKQLEIVSITSVVKPLISKLKRKYIKFQAVIDYLSAVQADIVNNVSDFIKQDEKTNLLTFSMENVALTKYKVNLFVDNQQTKSAPIIFETLPSYSTLVCRVEHTSQSGMLTTNLTLIKPGALHLANGGYLIIEARKLKKNPEGWEALKSALFSREIQIKPVEHEVDVAKPISLEPMPIPLNIKIILIGDRNTYYSLCQKDPDFYELFKVAVDFNEDIARNKKNIQLYARLIATIARYEKLQAFNASAVAAIIDHSTRLADDIEKLSTYVSDIKSLVLESAYWSGLSHKKTVDSDDVAQALQAQIHRMDRSRDLYYEDIKRDFIIINTNESVIGQVNCLSVRRVGNFSYGHPTRVTARVRLGRGKIIDIQREIKMAGALHSKAGLIISNYLASQFNSNHPFALFASLAFEQIYCWTDGDSASVGELCALLSALAEVPLHQSLAVTGSIDQYGVVQAVGGVNEKIEGFFDVCQAKGLTGKQGVLIPAINQKNLMLREDIQEAARKNRFFIYSIETMDDAISLLTEMSAEVIHEKIEKRLHQFANARGEGKGK